VAFACGLLASIIRAQNCRSPWRDDDVRRRAALPGGGPVDGLAIIAAVRSQGSDLAFELAQQRRRLGRVISSAVRQRMGYDLTGADVYSKAQLKPAPVRSAMLPSIPLAQPEQLEPPCCPTRVGPDRQEASDFLRAQPLKRVN
jgi:hypothetical protein